MKAASFLFVLVIFCSPCFAQKGGIEGKGSGGPVGIFGSQAEYYEFMGNAKRAAYGPNGNSELRAMIPMLNDIALNKPFGFTSGKYNTESSNFGMLSNEKVRQELEMVDHQFEELKKVNSQVQKRVAEEIRGLDFSKRENLTVQIKGIRDRAKKELDAVFLPHQLKRLEQIQFQSQLRRRSIVDIITSDPLKEDLEITEAQTTMLRKEEEKIEEEIQKKIAKLREEAREQLLSKLKPDQEKRVNELVGDAFDFGKEEQRKKTGKRKK